MPADTRDAATTPLVPFCPFRCPSCGEAKPRTYGKTGRIRYHRCRACGLRYRSLELQRPPLFLPPVGAPA